MNKKGLLLRVLCAAVAFAVLVFSGGCTAPTIELCTGGGATPEQCFEEFISHINSGRFEEADACLYNYETLGFASPGGDQLYGRMFSHLQQSRKAVVTKEVSREGDTVRLEVELTTLDYRKVETALAALTTQQAQEIKMDGVEITDDAQIKEIMSQCYDRLMENPAEQYTTALFELDMVKREGRWMIICTEEFYSALIGYAM